MSQSIPASALELRSTVTRSGALELTLESVPVPSPKDDEVLVRIEATPINPSDLGLLLASADPSALRSVGSAQRPKLVADLPLESRSGLEARVDQSLPVGNEGAGVVVAAGAASAAQALLGRTVAAVPGGMYAQYRCIKAGLCLPLPQGTEPAAGAACFVNPLTALAMTEAMRREGHSALVHTAAASNLGRMLVRLCRADGIPLVNVVRRPEQAAELRELGAEHVVCSGDGEFDRALTDAVAATGATLAFDATGGGRLADRILCAMESAASRKASRYERYGSTTHKQVYVYGNLDRSPTLLTRSYGMYWSVSGWLVASLLARIGPEATQALRLRIASELDSTFASRYAHEISLRAALEVDVVRDYARQATGNKYLIRPQA